MKNFKFCIFTDIQVTIISDSICKYIKGIHYTEVKAFPGANISRLTWKIQKDMSLISKPFTILHVGTNDISQKDLSIEKIISLYNNLITFIQENSKTEVIVSSVLPRPVDLMLTEYKVKETNRRLRSKCLQRRVKFVASYHPFLKGGKPVTELFAVRDGGLHLNFEGIRKLKSIFVNVVSHLPLNGK